MNKNLFFLFLLVLFFAEIGCNNGDIFKNNKPCEEFNIAYPKLLALHKEDTSILIKGLDRLIEKNENCKDAYLTRADIYFFQDSLLSAENDYLKVVSLDSTNTYSLFQLGLLFHNKNMEDSAIYFLQKSLNSKKSSDSSLILDYNSSDESLKTSMDKYDIPTDEIIYLIKGI